VEHLVRRRDPFNGPAVLCLIMERTYHIRVHVNRYLPVGEYVAVVKSKLSTDQVTYLVVEIKDPPNAPEKNNLRA
jgi:hypothetical protein